MPAWKTFKDLAVGPPQSELIRPRLSLTSDILSFRRCSRQYGYFGNDGFVPAQATQIYYGTIIHQVLDKAHRHFAGFGGYPPGTMPTTLDIERYFDEVQTALLSHGVRPASPAVAQKAKRVLAIFNRVEGPVLYPLIRNTEYRLESDRDRYILRGVVDVLARNREAPDDPAQMEIWDYKGSRFPDLSSEEMQNYVWQMCVYAELYRVRSGQYPAKAILYFLNELDLPIEPDKRPLRAIHEVTFSKQSVEEALSQFDITARSIISCRAGKLWPLPPQQVPVETCDICDIRWSCPVPKKKYELRLPFIEK